MGGSQTRFQSHVSQEGVDYLHPGVSGLPVLEKCCFMYFFPSTSGMDILNGAIESLISSSNKEDWTPVALSVADATVTISKDQVR